MKATRCPVGWTTFIDPVKAEICETHDDRIRELEEAERTCKAANESQHVAIHGLEARVKELERILETEHDDNCQWRMAEVGKLNARVKELEASLWTS